MQRPKLDSTLKAALCLALIFFTASCSLPRLMVREDPLTAREHLELGLSYEQSGKLELAEKEYLAAAEELPLAHHLLGNLYFTREEYDQSEEAYKEAVEGLPEDPRPRNNLAWLYYTRGENLEEARSLAQEAVSLAPPCCRDAYMDTLHKIEAALAGK